MITDLSRSRAVCVARHKRGNPTASGGNKSASGWYVMHGNTTSSMDLVLGMDNTILKWNTVCLCIWYVCPRIKSI